MRLIFTLSTPRLRTLAVGLRAFNGEFSFDWSRVRRRDGYLCIADHCCVFILFQNYFVNGLSGAVKG